MERRGAPAGADRDRFRVLFDENFADVWSFLRRRCASSADADDAAAETFAVAWRRRDDLPTGPGARLWLFGTARNVLANQRRADARRSRLQARIESLAPTHVPVADPADAVADRAADRLRCALASLPESDRDLLVLRVWDALTVGEIASLLDITPNAVSVRLTRARGRLAAALDRTDPTVLRTGTGRSPHPKGDAS